MTDRAFVDTNVLVYGYSNHEPDKREKALAIVAEPSACSSIQTLNEFSSVMRKKFKEPHANIRLALDEIVAGIDIFSCRHTNDFRGA